MKKIKTLLFITLFGITNLCAQEFLELTNESKKLGLVAYLTTTRYVAEAKFISMVSQPAFKTNKEKQKEIVASYNMIRLYTSQLINQLSADMYKNNTLKPYSKIDYFFKGRIDEIPEKFNSYNKLIKKIDAAIVAINFKSFSSANGASLEEVTGVLELVSAIYKDQKEFKEKKIQSLTALLKDVKMLSARDLIVKPEKE